MKKSSLCIMVSILIILTFPVLSFAQEPSPVPSGAPQETTMQPPMQSLEPSTSQTVPTRNNDADTTAESKNTQDTDSTASPAPTDNPAPEQTFAALFSIDTENVYEGMDRPYKNGYMPAVSGNKAVVVLPLISSGNIKDNMLMASVDLGDPSSAPFVFKSYGKQVKLENKQVNNGAGVVSAYYVAFELDLSASRYIGTYPVIITVRASNDSGEPIEQAFTLYVRITEGTDPNATPEPEPIATPAPEAKPTSQPIVLVTGSVQSPAPVEAGKEFTVDIILTNTNEKKYVQNMTATLSCEVPGIDLLEDSNTIYVKKLGKSESITISARYKTGLEVPAGKHTINVALAYDNPEAATLASSGVVSIEVKQPLKIELTMPQIAAEVNAGDTLPLALQVMNLSRTMVYNVRCELSAPGLLPTGTGFIGNMEAGTAANTDMNVFIGTKDMSEGYSGEEKYGYTSGTLTLIYENADGEESRQEYDIATTIKTPVITTTEEPDEEPETQTQWWIALIIAAVVIGAVVILLVLRNKRKRERQDEDL